LCLVPPALKKLGKCGGTSRAHPSVIAIRLSAVLLGLPTFP